MPNDVSRTAATAAGSPATSTSGCGLSSEEIQQEFARRSDEPSRRFAAPGSHSLVGPGPLELEPHVAQAPSKKPRRASDVAPQGCIEIRRIAPRPPAVRPAHVLVMDEELVEVGNAPDPTDAEEARRRPRPDLIDERREVAPGQLRGTRRGQPMPPPGKNEARCREVVVLTQHEVGSEIASGPRVEQGRRVGTEFGEELAQR